MTRSSAKREAQRTVSPEMVEKVQQLAYTRARTEFYPFRQIINPKLQWGWFTYELANTLQEFYTEYIAGKRPVLLINTPPQHGKGIISYEEVLTSNGWSTHGELQVGDKVMHPSGAWTTVLAVTEEWPVHMRVELTNGQVIHCHDPHEWTVNYRMNRPGTWKTLETKEILCRGCVSGKMGKRGGGRYLYQLPEVLPLWGTRQHLAVAPYALGVWLGNGTWSSPAITQAAADFSPVEEMVRLGYEVSSSSFTSGGSAVRYLFAASSSRSLCQELRSLGLMKAKNKKFIPDQYLIAPVEDRLQLLAGLIDTDGSVFTNGRVTFTNADEQLLDSFERLLSTFGWYGSRCQITTVGGIVNGRQIVGTKPCYQVSFNPTLEIPLKVERKFKAQRSIKRSRAIAIKSITRSDTPYGMGRCITVDAPDGLYCVGKTMQPTHNSTTVIDFISWMVGRHPELKIIFTSFSDRLCRRANLTMQRILEKECYKSIFLDTVLPPKGSSMYLRNTDILEFVGTGGYFRATTVGGPITGEEMDIGVIDDPIKGRAEANSIKERDRVWGWLTDDFFSRFSERAAVVVILTRWHVDDPGGRLIEHFGKRLKLIKFPAIAEQDERYRLKGAPLFPEHKSLDFLKMQRGLLTRSSWESIWQQSPIIIGGGLFPIEKFKTAPVIDRSKIIASVRSWDKAISEGDNAAYSVGVLMHKMNDGTFLIEHVERGRWGVLAREQRIRFWAENDSARCKNYQVIVEMEPGSGGKESAEATIRNLAGFAVIADRPTGKGSKETRAEPFAAQVQGGNVYLAAGSWNYAYLDEAACFPNGKFKDQIDASSAAFNYLTLTLKFDTSLSWVS